MSVEFGLAGGGAEHVEDCYRFFVAIVVLEVIAT